MTKDIILTAGFGDYDRTAALHQGRITVDGCKLAPIALPPAELFPRAFQRAEFDVSEISVSTQLIQLSRGKADYVALPIFLSRAFRFDAIYIRSDGDVRVAGDLSGRTVGIPEFQMTAAVWVRGILQDHFGVDLKSITYRTGGVNEPGRRERVPLKLPPEWTVRPIGQTETLNAMLLAGEIDAIIAPHPPAAFLDEASGICRLFSKSGDAERAYFADTGIFPIMHAVGLRRSIYEQKPQLAAALVRAFGQAKQLAFDDMARWLTLPATPISLPWFGEELRRTMSILGDDPWPYGVARNRSAIEALCRYAHEQGLLDRPCSPDELFPVSDLD